MIDRQRLALGGSVEYGAVHINYVVTWTANQSGLVTLTFWPWKWCPSHV